MPDRGGGAGVGRRRVGRAVDLAEWTRWWVGRPASSRSTRMRARCCGRGSASASSGNRPGGPTRGWIVEVLDVHPKERIDLLYAEGDMYGRTSWELDVVPGGTEVAYVYHGVRPLNAEMAASWRRWGSGSHECNMRLATLPGLARYVTGEPLDDAWRAAGEGSGWGVHRGASRAGRTWSRSVTTTTPEPAHLGRRSRRRDAGTGQGVPGPQAPRPLRRCCRPGRGGVAATLEHRDEPGVARAAGPSA